MPYCQNCKNEIAEDAKFCINCGQNVAQTPNFAKQENLCPICKNELKFIDIYQRWWCNKCEKYRIPRQKEGNKSKPSGEVESTGFQTFKSERAQGGLVFIIIGLLAMIFGGNYVIAVGGTSTCCTIPMWGFIMIIIGICVIIIDIIDRGKEK